MGILRWQEPAADLEATGCWNKKSDFFYTFTAASRTVGMVF
jgi:hypothetical protein